jgi:hypothetical protein
MIDSTRLFQLSDPLLPRLLHQLHLQLLCRVCRKALTQSRSFTFHIKTVQTFTTESMTWEILLLAGLDHQMIDSTRLFQLSDPLLPRLLHQLHLQLLCRVCRNITPARLKRAWISATAEPTLSNGFFEAPAGALSVNIGNQWFPS